VKVYLPDGLEAFAREFSQYKTPAARTQGWVEQDGEVRGEGDVMDTVGTLMLWRHLVAVGIPATYHLTANAGDETDLRVFTSTGSLDINVKTSKWQPYNDGVLPARGFIGIKEVELDKPSDVYVQVIVHLRPPNGEVAHVHLCNWITSASEEFKKLTVSVIPNTNGQRGLWIARPPAHPIENLIPWLRSN
jgi:hypothetical protein